MLTLTKRKRKRTYYAEGRVNGERVHQSLKTKDVQIARALLRDLELRLLSGGRVVSKQWKDFAAEFKAWVSTTVKTGHDSTMDRYEFVVDRFSRFLEAKTVLEVAHVDSAVLAAYSEDRQNDVHPCTRRQATANTVRSDMRILHRIFSYAVESGYIQKNPVTWLKARRGGRTQPYTAGETAAMLQDRILVQKPMLRAIVLMFLFTGLRISDVIGLSVKAVDGGRIITKTKKRGKVVSLALHPELKAALELYYQCRTLAQRDSAFVFSNPDGTPLDRRALTSTLKRLFARCGIKGGHPHRFRDTFAVQLLQQGASLYDVAKLLGIDVSTAEEYYSPYCKELQARGERLIFALHSPGVVTESFDPTESGKVVTFCAPLSPALGQSGEEEAKTVARTSRK